jgi:hypothetical protein
MQLISVDQVFAASCAAYRQRRLPDAAHAAR